MSDALQGAEVSLHQLGITGANGFPWGRAVIPASLG